MAGDSAGLGSGRAADAGDRRAVAYPASTEFFRRKRLVLALAATAGGTQLLALRALANRPLRRLAKVDSDPVGAWRREEVAVIHGLAALELRSAGMRVRASAR